MYSSVIVKLTFGIASSEGRCLQLADVVNGNFFGFFPLNMSEERVLCCHLVDLFGYCTTKLVEQLIYKMKNKIKLSKRRNKHYGKKK